MLLPVGFPHDPRQNGNNDRFRRLCNEHEEQAKREGEREREWGKGHKSKQNRFQRWKRKKTCERRGCLGREGGGDGDIAIELNDHDIAMNWTGHRRVWGAEGGWARGMATATMRWS